MSETTHAPAQAAPVQHTAAAPSQTSLLRRQTTDTAGPTEAPSIVHATLASSGQPLDAAVRAEMGARFGHDFSQVRVHTDAQAAESAAAVQAYAYTVGRDVVFGAGQYAPHTIEGQRMIAHELTHVVQQSAMSPGSSLTVGPAQDPYEQEATTIEQRLGAGGSVDHLHQESPGTQAPDVAHAAQPRVQRETIRIQRDPIPNPYAGTLDENLWQQGYNAGLAQPGVDIQPVDPLDDKGVQIFLEGVLAANTKATPKATSTTTSASQSSAEHTAYLDQQYHNWLGEGDYEHAAIILNEFNVQDIETRLDKLTLSQIGALHDGAIKAQGVGAGSNLAIMTKTPESVGSLDKQYRNWLREQNYVEAARCLNGFNVQDIEKKLGELKVSQIKALHDGAIKAVGETANLTIKTGTTESLAAFLDSLPPPRTPFEAEAFKKVLEARHTNQWGLYRIVWYKGEIVGFLSVQGGVTWFFDIQGNGLSLAEKPIESEGLGPLELLPYDRIASLSVSASRTLARGLVRGISRNTEKALAEETERLATEKVFTADTERMTIESAIDRNVSVPSAENKSLGISQSAHSVNPPRIDPDIDQAVERGIVEESTATNSPTRRPRLRRPAATGRAAQVRKRFNALQKRYAQKLGVIKGGQVHHAIELQTLDRYPGVFSQSELNDFSNMRGIPPEKADARQLHNSKVREVWDRHYRNLDDEITIQGLTPGTKAYNDLVRQYIEDGRDEIDYVLGQFFSEQTRSVFQNQFRVRVDPGEPQPRGDSNFYRIAEPQPRGDSNFYRIAEPQPRGDSNFYRTAEPLNAEDVYSDLDEGTARARRFLDKD